MSDEKEEFKKAVQSLAELREEVKKSAPDQEKVARLEESFKTIEASSAAILKKQKAQEQKELDTKERIDELELALARGTSGGEKNYKDTPEYKALERFVIVGENNLHEEMKSLLRTDSDTQGGFLAPTEMDSVIIKKITEISAIRSISRVRTIASKSMELPIRNTLPVATYEGESDSGEDSASTYQNETITPFRQTFTTPITQDMLMDGAFNMESEIMSDTAEAFALGEGRGFVVGSGHKQPKGFLQDDRIDARESTTSGTIDADDVILVTGDLKTGYMPTYVFNRRTLAALRTLKATDGNFLWQPGLNGVVANTINIYFGRLGLVVKLQAVAD